MACQGSAVGRRGRRAGRPGGEQVGQVAAAWPASRRNPRRSARTWSTIGERHRAGGVNLVDHFACRRRGDRSRGRPFCVQAARVLGAWSTILRAGGAGARRVVDHFACRRPRGPALGMPAGREGGRARRNGRFSRPRGSPRALFGRRSGVFAAAGGSGGVGGGNRGEIPEARGRVTTYPRLPRRPPGSRRNEGQHQW
jgi:hypothetical protein